MPAPKFLSMNTFSQGLALEFLISGAGRVDCRLLATVRVFGIPILSPRYIEQAKRRFPNAQFRARDE